MATSFPLPSSVAVSSSLTLESTPRSIGVDIFDLQEYWESGDATATGDLDERLFKPCVIGVFDTGADLIADEQSRCRALSWHHTTIASLLRGVYPDGSGAGAVPVRGPSLPGCVTGQDFSDKLEEKDATVYIASWNFKTFRCFTVKALEANIDSPTPAPLATDAVASSSPLKDASSSEPSSPSFERRSKKGQEKIVEAVAFDFVSTVMSQVLGEDSTVELYQRIGLAAAEEGGTTSADTVAPSS